MDTAFKAVKYSLPESARDAFSRSHDDWIQKVDQRCRLPRRVSTYSLQQRLCALNAYAARANSYRSRLNGDALAETRLSPEQRAELQTRLIALGLLHGEADGQFGSDTRSAIWSYQEQIGEPPTGFFSAAQRIRLAEGPALPPGPGPGPQPPPDDSPELRASNEKRCQSEDANDRLAACTAIIDDQGKGYKVALADAYDGRCRSYNDQHMYDRAVQDCKAAIARNSRNKYAYNHLGAALTGQGDVQSALAAYSTSINLDPNWIYSHLARGHIYADMGEKDKAKIDFDKVLSVDPSNQQAKDVLGLLQVDSPILMDARLYLDDARQFVSGLKQAPDSISQIANAAVDLEVALKGFNDLAASRAKTRLTDLLVPLPGFQDFVNGRQEDRNRANKERLVTTIEKSTILRACADNYVKSDISNPKNPVANKLRDALDSAVKHQNITEIDKSSGEITDFFQANGIRCELTPAPESGPAVTDKTRPVLEGSSEDMVLLYNSGSSAPSVTKDISGKFVFLTGSASVCFAESPGMDEDRRWFLQRTLRQDGVKEVKEDSSSCDFAKVPMESDFVVFQRGELFKQRKDYINGLTDLLQNEALREYRVVSAAEYNDAVQGMRAQSLQIASDVEFNKRTGFGVIIVTDVGSPACAIAEDRVTELGLPEVLERDKELISRRLRFDWNIVNMTTDSAFVALTRQQCGYAAGDTNTLRTLMLALRRDGKKYEFAPIWFTTEDLIAAGTNEIKRRDALEKAKADQNNINEAQRKQQEAQQQAIEGRLRSENGPRARALRDKIDGVVKVDAFKPLTDKSRKATETQGPFPTFASWLNWRFDDQWETTDVVSEIADFGKVQWNRRTLDGIMVQTTITQKNRIKGVYEKSCFVFGMVDDDEFSMSRDMYGVQCDTSRPTLEDWKSRREFKSLWNAVIASQADLQSGPL